jgi:membrane protease YdiL (CAAX protease family)
MSSNLEPTNSSGDEPPVPGDPSNKILETIFLGPNGMRAGWRAGLYLAMFVFFAALLQTILKLVHLSPPAQPGGGMAPGWLLAQELVLFAGALAAAGVMALIEGRSVAAYGLPWRGAFGARFWQGGVWGIAQLSAIMLLIRALGGYTFGTPALHDGEVLRYAALWAVVFLAVSFAEEFLFRGYLLLTLATSLGFWPAALLFSLLFGAVHLRNPGEGPAGALSVFAIAMFLCLTLRRTGDLWLAIGWHAAFDFGETYLYSVPNSGIVMQGHLLNASLHGPRWISGGPIGPEGSAAAFAVLAVVFVVFNRLYRPRGT